MSLSAIIKALIDAGATPRMILAAVEADEQARNQEIENKREKDRLRKRNKNISTESTEKERTPSDGFPDPSLTPPLTPKEKTPKGVKKKNPLSLPDWIPVEQWEALLEIRKSKKVDNTEYALKRLLSKLDGFRLKGHDPTEVLNESIDHGWKTVYEPKEKINANRNYNKSIEQPNRPESNADRNFRILSEMAQSVE